MGVEEELIRRLKRISFEDMQELFRNTDIDSNFEDSVVVTIAGLRYRFSQHELDLFTQNGWTIEDFIKCSR